MQRRRDQADGLQADAVTAALYRKIGMPPPQRALAAAMWHLWRQQRIDLDKSVHSATRKLSHLLCVTDLSAPSVSDLERLLSEPDGPAVLPEADEEDTAGTLFRGIPGPAALPQPPVWAAVAAPLLPPQPAPPASGAGLERFIDGMDCAACRAAVRAAGVPCAPCAAALARKMLGADGRTTALAGGALRNLQRLQQDDADSFVATMLAVTMPGVVFSTAQIAMHVPLVLSHGVPLMDWLQLCQTASQQIKHDELMGAFVSPMLEARMVISHRGPGSAAQADERRHA